MNRDTVIGIVGAAILLVAMVGVFQYEQRASVSAASGTVGWALNATAGPALQETTGLGQTTDGVVAIEQGNLTNVTFVLTWSGGGTLALAVTPPEGVPAEEGALTAEGSSGTLTLTIPVPNGNPAAGVGDGRLGVGDWSVSVHFRSANGVEPPVAPPGGVVSASWELATTLEGWMPTA